MQCRTGSNAPGAGIFAGDRFYQQVSAIDFWVLTRAQCAAVATALRNELEYIWTADTERTVVIGALSQRCSVCPLNRAVKHRADLFPRSRQFALT
jgi:hypothetical protein